MKILILLLSFGISLQAAANKEVGNGGDVVVCRGLQKEILSIELLDYYEARELRQMNINIDVSSIQTATPELIHADALKTLERIKTLNPFRYQKYVGYLDSFFSEALFVSGKVLTDVPDSDHLFLPLGCGIEQIAIQNAPLYPHDPRYIINKDLWTALSLKDAVGLVLHEIIYREMILAGFNNSTPVRYFNSLTSANAFANMKPIDYIQVLVSVPLPDFDYNGLTLSICYPGSFEGKFSPCNEVKSPGFFRDQVTSGFVVPPFAPWAEGRSQIWKWNENTVAVAGPIQFDTQTQLVRSITPDNDGYLRTEQGLFRYTSTWDFENIDCRINWECFAFENLARETRQINFFPSGRLRSIYTPYIEEAQPGTTLDRCSQRVQLYESGQVESCWVSQTRFENAQYSFLINGETVFSENGDIIDAKGIDEGRLFLKNQIVTQITKYNHAFEDAIIFSTNKGLETEFLDHPIEFAAGTFSVTSPSFRLFAFKVKSPVELKPNSLFPNSAFVTGAALDHEIKTQIESVDLAQETYLHPETSQSFYYPAHSRVWFTFDGDVAGCRMLNPDGTTGESCHLH